MEEQRQYTLSEVLTIMEEKTSEITKTMEEILARLRQ